MLYLSVLFLPVGILMLIKPKLFWMITESWKSYNATEPSSLFIFSTRFGGIILSIIGILGICALIFV